MPDKTIKNILNSKARLIELEQIITKNDKNKVLSIEHIINLSKLNSVGNSKTLDIWNTRRILNELQKTYYGLLDQSDLSEPLKCTLLFMKLQSLCILFLEFLIIAMVMSVTLKDQKATSRSNTNWLYTSKISMIEMFSKSILFTLTEMRTFYDLEWI